MNSTADPLEANDLLKLATIYRDSELNVIYVCYHCGHQFTNSLDTLTHVESHFDSKVKAEMNIDNDGLVFGDGLHSVHETDNLNESKLLMENFNQVMLSDNWEPDEEDIKPDFSELIKTHPPSQCKLCDESFPTPLLLILHVIKNHSNSATMDCPECSQNWTDEATFLGHLQQHIDDNETTYLALIDNVTSKCRTILTVDTIAPPWTKYQRRCLKTCDICSSTFANKTELNSHISKEHKKEQFDCDKCKRKVSGKFTLYAHKYAHLTENDQANYSDDETLRQNLRKFLDGNVYCDESNADKKTFGCRLCSHLSVANRKSAVHHIFQKHVYFEKKKRTKGPHVCDDCGMVFANNSNLSGHKLLHTGLTPFTCPICNKSFATLRYLRSHEITHSDLKPHQCAMCGLTLKTLARLNHHIREIHTTVTTNCTICNKELKSHRLKKHMRDVHENEHRPYQCTICLKAFKTAKTMRTHSYRHSGEKKFECRFDCKERFVSAAARRAHERSKHKSH